MTFKKSPGLEDPDKVPRSVVGLTIELASIHETDTHQHQKAQLLYVISGVITVEASNGVWTVPPHCAIWIPSGVAHLARPTGRVTVGSLYIDAALTGSLSDGCGILFVQPLLRELLFRFIATPGPYPDGDTREARLVSVLLDELQAAPLEPLRLPMPTDRRLRRLAETLMDDPSLRFTIEEWGARIGASNRTVTRLFQRETGMSFGRWRQQLHVGLALQRLASGQSVMNVAFDLGYESTSAFIAMFRRMLGTTPARYFSEVAEGGQDRGTPELRQPDSDSSCSPDIKSFPRKDVVDFKMAARRYTKPQT